MFQTRGEPNRRFQSSAEPGQNRTFDFKVRWFGAEQFGSVFGAELFGSAPNRTELRTPNRKISINCLEWMQSVTKLKKQLIITLYKSETYHRSRIIQKSIQYCMPKEGAIIPSLFEELWILIFPPLVLGPLFFPWSMPFQKFRLSLIPATVLVLLICLINV